jgi:hypothetical protein
LKVYGKRGTEFGGGLKKIKKTESEDKKEDEKMG